MFTTCSTCTLFSALITWSVCGEAFKLTQSGENEYLKLHHRMTKREVKQYFGVETHNEVPEYDVTSPFQADNTGEFLSYKLHEHARHKRDADEPNAWYYKMVAFGMSLHFNLTKSNNLFGPGLVVEKIHKNGSKGYSTPPHTAFYEGHVTSDPNSVVAISNHDGLKGIVNFKENSFFMQPLPGHLAKHYGSSGGSRPHLIYRRSLDLAKSKCEVPEERSKRGVPVAEKASQSSTREARSVSEKHMEVMVVGDHLYLQRFNSEDEATKILLLLAHMVNAMYHDNSAGAIKLTLSVVRVVIHQGFSYSASDSNSARLDALETWVNSDMPMSDADPQHADQVILVTGSGFGGLAKASSTCTSAYGPSVSNGDMGLGSAFQIAHETAHALGVNHDVDSNSPECPDGTYIMSTATIGGRNASKWSSCSRSQLQTFLSGSSSSCLDDKPTDLEIVSSDYHQKLPGQLQDGNAQCALQYGTGYQFCIQKQSNCGSLYCTQDGVSCVSQFAPPADGTKCGERRWCIKGECVDDGSPMIDGGWSEWSDYSSCSYSCGGGVQYKSRTCTNPTPQNGGMDCEGESVGQWRICNPQACSEGTRTYREEQCEIKVPGSVPYMADPCSLHCRVGSAVYPKGRVADGTRCSMDKKNKSVCIKGECRSVGCDDVLESGVKEDRCKVCNGDATSCKIVATTITNPCQGTCTILDVPVGSTDVSVKEEVKDWNFLGVKDEWNENVYNVGYTWSTTVDAAGTKVYYTHEENEDADKVFIPGPTNAHLKVYYWQFVAAAPVDFVLKEPVGSDESPPVVKAGWNISEWSKCSHACAGGFQTRKVECVVTEDGSYLNDAICEQNSPKPVTKQSCNSQSCKPFWYVSGWRPCSQTCGKGVQTRQILCRQEVSRGQFNTLADSQCTAAKPEGPETRDCNKIDCPAEKLPGEWSACSTSCRAGVKTRSTSCQRLKETGVFESVPEVMCSAAITPVLQEDCNQDVPCAGDRQYVPLGCYRDNTGDRTLPILVTNLRSNINWNDMSQTIDKCAKSTAEYDHKLKVFALQFYGECYSGYNGLDTYDDYGSLPYSDTITNNCWAGVGASGINFVYKFEEYKR